MSSCSNNSQDSPSKLFISVPKPDNRRKLWFKSIGANYRSSRRVYCCEDHFNVSGILFCITFNNHFYITFNLYVYIKN